MDYLILFTVGYLISSIPVIALLVKYSTGISLHEVGSGNTGVANAFRHAPRWVGITGVIWQVVTTITFLLISRVYFNIGQLGLYIGLSGLIIGNLYPLFNRFKGSKGRTILQWGLLYINPLVVGIYIAGWLIVFLIKKESILAMNIQLCLSPFVVYFIEGSTYISFVVLIIALILLITNTKDKDDIKQVMKGE